MSDVEKCHICEKGPFKYKCPACEYKTCSLKCVKLHKTRTNCSGIRNKTGMVEKHEMDNFTLLSDYRFLEEIDHKLEEGLRNPILRGKVRQAEDFSELPIHLKKLKIEAKKRGTVLEYMPRNYSKHQENSTRLHFKEKKIRWHIKWMFPHADVTYVDKSVDENLLIVDVLRKFMEPQCRLDPDDTETTIDEDLSKRLEYYQSASYNKISVLLKLEMCRMDAPYTELVLSQSFKDNFASKKIIEYPVLYVVFKDHISAFIDPNTQLSDRFEAQDSFSSSSKSGVSDISRRTKKDETGLSFFGEMFDNSGSDS